MASKLTRLTHKMAIQLLLVADSSTFRSSRSRRPVRKLLNTSSHILWDNSLQYPLHCCRYCVLLHREGSPHPDRLWSPPKRDADYSPPSCAEVKNEWSYTPTPLYFFKAWCLIKQTIHLHGVLLSSVNYRPTI